MAATVFTIPPFNLSLKALIDAPDLKDAEREFHVEHSR